MRTFESAAAAEAFISEVIDQPLVSAVQEPQPGITLAQSVMEKPAGAFANVYDLSFVDEDVRPEIIAFGGLNSTHKFLSQGGRRYNVATSGGFFYLADIGSSTPRQRPLNLSVSEGELLSLPVVDRYAVIAGSDDLTARKLAALGMLDLNGRSIMWSGSLTDYDTEAKVYGNGNVVINHQNDALTGTQRVLDESSRYTPPIEQEGYKDVGFISRGDNEFVGVGGSNDGGVDIFAHDFVVRCPEKYFQGVSVLTVQTIGGISLERFTGGAFSAGPALNTADFSNDPVNLDRSLGGRPPFADVAMARTVLFRDAEGYTHIRLFDGRPGSPVFPGVTPDEAVQQIVAGHDIVWGCFLDPGQTAKLSVREDAGVMSYGNRHYMRWPSPANPNFIWTPELGRLVANVIVL
ncbi:MAG TPA: hypothetical protein VLF59_04430 [Candidatus Saccharimonadales bacterium]|nr:hypothetical protein [Candidatus Saccharimonadales bacterium]